MALMISDELLQQARLTEGEARIEFACFMYDQERLNIHQAAKLAGMSRYEFEAELRQRGLPVYHVSLEDLKQDLESLKRLGT